MNQPTRAYFRRIEITVIASCLFTSSMLTSMAQSIDRKQPSTDVVRTFKSGGANPSTRDLKPPPRPAPLSAFDLKRFAAHGAAESASVYARLTPKEPSVADKGALVFVDPTLVEGGENYAVWRAGSEPLYKVGQSTPPRFGSEGYLVVWINAHAGKRYLIDCAVQSSDYGARFRVVGPSGTAPMEVDGLPAGQHLVFLLLATESRWHAFQVIGTGSLGEATIGPKDHKEAVHYYTPMLWNFYSCEVTNL